MKKLVIVAALAALVGVAYAGDVAVGTYNLNYGQPSVGLRAGHNFQSVQNPVGVTLGTKYDKIGVEASFDRATAGPVNVNQYGLVGSYDVYTFKGATIAVKGGAAYVDPAHNSNGWLGIVGFGVSYPVAKNVNLVADYSYQNGSSAVSAYNGNVVTVGAKYSF